MYKFWNSQTNSLISIKEKSWKIQTKQQRRQIVVLEAEKGAPPSQIDQSMPSVEYGSKPPWQSEKIQPRNNFLLLTSSE